MLQLSSLMSIFMSRIYRSKLGVVSLYIIIKSEHLAFDEGETYGGGGVGCLCDRALID